MDSKESHIIGALRAKGDDYEKDFTEDVEKEEKESKENSVTTLLSKAETLEGDAKDEALNSLISRLEKMKTKKK